MWIRVKQAGSVPSSGHIYAEILNHTLRNWTWENLCLRVVARGACAVEEEILCASSAGCRSNPY
jgi:hypothetical protein